MRSKNYDNQVDSFTPLEPQEMVRVALIEGLKPGYKEAERQRYRRLVKEHTDLDPASVDLLFRLFSVENPTMKQEETVDDLLNSVDYKSRHWKDLDYESLKKEGVVIEYDGRPSGLIKKVLETDESKVIFTHSSLGDDGDYLKHIHWSNKFVLNGYDAVERFAQEKGFNLSESAKTYRRLTEKDYQLLEQHRFYFNEALRMWVTVSKDEQYKNRNISALSARRKDGSETMYHPHDFAETAEFLVYCNERGIKAEQTLGNLLTRYGDKYHGLNEFLVPKRSEEGKFNEVEMHYLPDFRHPEKRVLEWINTIARCNCDHALNLRNFEVRRGRRVYVIDTMDTHGGFVVLSIHKAKRINANESPNNLSPLITQEFSRVVDKLRYNVAEEVETEEGGKRKIRRNYVKEVGIEILIHELAKLDDWTFERMFKPKAKISTFMLRDMYREGTAYNKAA